jgi:hypothetical protein
VRERAKENEREIEIEPKKEKSEERKRERGREREREGNRLSISSRLLRSTGRSECVDGKSLRLLKVRHQLKRKRLVRRDDHWMRTFL